MQLIVQPPARRDLWVVEAYGGSGSGGMLPLRVEIYAGADPERARRAYLEARTLAAVSPSDDIQFNGREISSALSDAFEEYPDDFSVPFAWAANSWGWAEDPEFPDREGVLEGAEIFRIDASGAKLSVEVRLDPDDQALLEAAVEAIRDADGSPCGLRLQALFERAEILSAVSHAPASERRAPSV